MDINLALVVSIITVLSLLFYSQFLRRKYNYGTLPPGPVGDPLIGHVRQIPFEYPWRTFSSWAKKYGSIVYFNALGRPMILLNSVSDAKELMERKGLNFSDRPPLVIMTELMGWDTTIAFMRYGDRFKRQRRLIEQTLNPKKLSSFYPLQINATYVLLGDLLTEPLKFVDHFKKLTMSTLMLTTYGYKVKSADDEYLSLIERVMRMTVEAGSHSATVVDFFPILIKVPSWMPGAGFKRHATETKKYVRELLERPFNTLRQKMSIGHVSPSLISGLLDDYQQRNVIDLEYEEDIKAFGATLLAAGFETTTSVLLTFLLAMVMHPDVVEKAQKEIDNVVGRDRLPNFDDRSSLKYIDYIIMETHRWNPATPLGIPHRSIKPDTHNGWFIPAGSTIIANIWHMMYDDKLYADPYQFNPDRFAASGVQDPREAVFGFGRRVCPGQHLADAELYLAIACILATFNIHPVTDKDGAVIRPKAEFTTGNASQPKPFKCRILPRDPNAEALIKRYCSVLPDSD